MKYLVDTSALVRLIRKQTDPGWANQVERGFLAVCEPALAETLQVADGKKYYELQSFIVDRYLPVVIPDGIWDQVAAIRMEMARHSAHHGPSVADLVIAATAIRLQLTVLHQDRDFETMARFVPELRQYPISAGPV